MSRRGLALLTAVVSLGLLPCFCGRALARGGAACGNVAVVDAGAKAYGYSGYSEAWTPVTLDASAEVRLAAENLGYVRTPFRVYSFNPTNSHWYWSNITGTPLGESALGSTTIFWSSDAAYAIASLWSIWRSRSWENGEQPVGGGSCGSFALVWTQHHAYAFHSATGQWMSQSLNEGISGGITCDNFGLVWTPQSVYSYDPSPGSWVPIDLGLTYGISVTGEGNVALAWSTDHAEAYSSAFDAWFPADGADRILDGTARGNLALFWSAAEAWVFDANNGTWNRVEIDIPPDGGGKPVDPVDVGSGFSVHPNPAPSDRVQLQLPGGKEWEVEVFDVGGRRVRSFRPETGASALRIDWDRTDDSGLRLAAGSYWIQARSEESVEVRRVLLLN